MSIRVDHYERGRNDNGKPICGVVHLLNPPKDDREAIVGEEGEVERDFLGRILHVADRALSQLKELAAYRTRGRGVH